MLKGLFRYLIIFSSVITDLLILYISAVLWLPLIAVNGQKDIPAPAPAVTVFIKSNGVHTDIIMPVHNSYMDWSQLIRYQHTDAKDSSLLYIGVGWGDKGFYLNTPEWSDLKFSTAFTAMFHLGSTAIHTTFYGNVVEDSLCYAVKLTPDNYRNLADYIINSFEIHEGQSIHIPSSGDGYGTTDAFYEAMGSYDLFHTCNTWTNQALKAAGAKAALWTVTSNGILQHYRH